MLRQISMPSRGEGRGEEGLRWIVGDWDIKVSGILDPLTRGD